MNIFRFLTLLGWTLIFSSCISAVRPSSLNLSDIIQASTLDDNRSSSGSRNNRRRTGKAGDCTKDTCEDICEDIYENIKEDEDDGVIERCLELNKKSLDSFETIIDYLSEPTLQNVRTVKDEYEDEFADMVDVSLFPWVDVTEKASRREAEALLIFVASESEIALALETAQYNYEGYDRYEGISELVEKIASGNDCDKHAKAFCEAVISGNDRFIDIVREERNSVAENMGIYLITYHCSEGSHTVRHRNAEAAVVAVASSIIMYSFQDACDGESLPFVAVEESPCDEIYSSFSAGRKCKQLDDAEFIALADVHDVFKTPTATSNLGPGLVAGFNNYVGISTDPLERSIDGYDSDEAQAVLDFIDEHTPTVPDSLITRLESKIPSSE